MTEHILRSHQLISILMDEDFYGMCPEFMFMRSQGLAGSKAYHAAVMDADSGKRNDSVIIRPALASFLRVLVDLLEYAGDFGLRNLRNYLCYRFEQAADTTRFVIYYMDQGEQIPIEI